MANKFTPGEWTIEMSDVHKSIKLPRIYSGDKEICTIKVHDFYNDNAINEAQANALLISKAPKLFNTCFEVRSKLINKFGLFGGGSEVNEIFELLNSAIEEVTNEE